MNENRVDLQYSRGINDYQPLVYEHQLDFSVLHQSLKKVRKRYLSIASRRSIALH